MNSMEWNSIRIFLAVAEQGSMSAAAQVLGMSQPTVSRHIQALEEKTGLNLFDRSTSGLKVTDVGSRLLESARDTASGAERFSRHVNANSMDLGGHVRLAVNELMGYYFLPEAISAFQREYPSIEVEILVSNSKVNLNKRDADISICQNKPEQPDLVVTHLADKPLGFSALSLQKTPA
ncbi:LysR family transcriptional regulator [Photobacterium sagamiensis]|uniref:LysR family transcriptional regulator n=1 Tax=Photobacterium sagamiensis TaxID=2910241 RepID=UPI003D10912C